MKHPAVTAAIVGARRPEQLDGIVGAADFTLSDEDMRAIGSSKADSSSASSGTVVSNVSIPTPFSYQAPKKPPRDSISTGTPKASESTALVSTSVFGPSR